MPKNKNEKVVDSEPSKDDKPEVETEEKCCSQGIKPVLYKS